MSLRAVLLSAAVALASCVPAAPPEATRAAAAFDGPLPAARRFAGPPRLRSAPVSHAQRAQDFLELSFALETGRALPVLTRFEGPVTVGVDAPEGALPPTLLPDLDDLLARLRREAGIDVARAGPGEMPSITISALPRASVDRAARGAICFVVPRAAGWRDFLARRGGPDLDWTTLTTRRRATIVLPSDVSPQEIRDCLHEELAQALGPLNDLYRLQDSVFNDDNGHVVLTASDMLILRATYDPALASGMTAAQVAARLPAILTRIDPAGRTAPRAPLATVDPAWTAAIRAALDPNVSDRARLRRARAAVARARAAGWRDARPAFAQLALGRAALGRDGGAALAAFREADRLYRALPGTALPRTQVAMQLAAYEISAGLPDAALLRLDAAIPVAEGAQNAALLATLLLLRAEAQTLRGDAGAAIRARAEGLAWGRYAWGDRVLAIRAAEVAGLAPAA